MEVTLVSELNSNLQDLTQEPNKIIILTRLQLKHTDKDKISKLRNYNLCLLYSQFNHQL